ncbi:hypothetical protein ACLOBS_06895 [Limosilactobacillus mucosae]|uniref:hypothetical protein n=1 Tax=Limosilactobacillus mucosae TaxID=97478 RepID=UPI003EBFDAAE
MLTKEKLSEITKQAIGTFHYTYAVAKLSSQNSFAIRLYDQLNDELVANSYIHEGDKPGLFTIDLVPERSNETDREVLRSVNSKLVKYIDGRVAEKYHIKLLNNDYGYLAKTEGTDSWSVTSLKIAKMSNQKATFTAVEIDDMQTDEAFANVNLWRAAEEVEED